MIKDITYELSDGTRLAGRYSCAKNESCFVLIFLGLGGDSSSKSVKYFLDSLAKQNISAVVFSSRGHAKSEGDFFLSKHIQDIQELERHYKNQTRSKFGVIGHSMSGRSLAYADVSSPSILINPGLFHKIPFWARLPILDRIYLAIMNYTLFRKVSFTRFATIKFSKNVLKSFTKELSNHSLPSIKLSTKCLLLLGGRDKVVGFDKEIIRDKAFHLLKKRYEDVHYKIYPNLDHQFSESHIFMASSKVDDVINSIKSFLE